VGEEGIGSDTALLASSVFGALCATLFISILTLIGAPVREKSQEVQKKAHYMTSCQQQKKVVSKGD
tara:strand:- start:253 stop:450 length:198 start_codon:yes stop_codon:yes gene_type:complete